VCPYPIHHTPYVPYTPYTPYIHHTSPTPYGLIYKKNWIRTPSIIYGAHVATTVWGLLAEFIYHTDILPEQKFMLFSFYAPYFVIPLGLMLYMAANPLPFGGGGSGGRGKGGKFTKTK
jgi:hypothetical protein